MKLTSGIALSGLLSTALISGTPAQAVEVALKVKPGQGLVVQIQGESAGEVKNNLSEEKPVQKAGENVEVETVYRVSEVVGMEVQNRDQEDLGEVNDMVIDLNSGKVEYAALSFGGVLGLGDKLFAIPWNAMKLRSEENSHFFVLGIDQERLKKAPGFDQDMWPDTADPKWNLETRERYATVKAAIDPVKPAKKGKQKEQGTPDYSAVMKISDVTGMAVRNPDQEDLGKIEELVINVNGGQVRYAALSFGGVLGLGDKMFAIPWDALQFKQNADESFFILSVSKERLKRAPGFDKDDWPDTANPNWRQEIDAYYQAKVEK